MEMRPLGRTGIQVSRYCLGAMMFGTLGNRDHDDVVRIIHRAMEAGVNFIDTADIYSHGESEEVIAKAIKGRRDDVVIATKFWGAMPRPDGSTTNRQGASRRWIMQAFEASLRRLGTDYIDLYQQHRFDSNVALEETLSALSDLIHQGKVRAVGSSTFSAERIVEAQWVSRECGFEPFRCEQPPYSLFRRSIEKWVLPTCRRYGMGVIVWSPMDGGWLSGRYRTAEDFTKDSRLVRQPWRPFDPATAVNQHKLALIGQLAAMADEIAVPLSHLATAWTVVHPDVTSVIIGPRTMEQLEDSLASSDVRLSDELLDRIDDLLPPGTDVNPVDALSDPIELNASYRRGGEV